MTEFEITQYIEDYIGEHGSAGLRITWLHKPQIPTLESMLQDMPALGLHFVLTPKTYNVGEISHPQGDPVPISTFQDILEVFKNRRKELGFEKTKDIATLLGMDHTYYGRIEKEQYKLSLKLMLRICRMLWIDVKVEPTNPDSK